MVIRPYYLEVLRKYRNAPIVKILSGIRRCGKSTILKMLAQDLEENGVSPDRIITVRYTSQLMAENMTCADMYRGIREKMSDEGKYYLLLDEVQEVDGWEKTVNSLLEDTDADIYVTGSNSKLMSSEISTYLSGRYVSIPVYTLSFAEYKEFKKDKNKSDTELLKDYIRTGGFPVVAANDFDEKTSYQVVEGIYNSVVTSDIMRRYNITNYELFQRTVKYVMENVGKTFSANSIVKFLKGEGRSLSVETVYNCLEWLEKAFVIYRCQRYDIQGKSVLKTQEKFFLADPSLKYCIMGFDPRSVASMLENTVYFELLRKGYRVYIGKNGTREIDFIASRGDGKIYVQVCRNLPDNSDREISNLTDINDSYPKYIVTLDEMVTGNIDGVRIIHLAEFLQLTDF